MTTDLANTMELTLRSFAAPAVILAVTSAAYVVWIRPRAAHLAMSRALSSILHDVRVGRSAEWLPRESGELDRFEAVLTQLREDPDGWSARVESARPEENSVLEVWQAQWLERSVAAVSRELKTYARYARLSGRTVELDIGSRVRCVNAGAKAPWQPPSRLVDLEKKSAEIRPDGQRRRVSFAGK